MNTLDLNRYIQSERGKVREPLRKTRAVLVMSAHWYFGATAVTAMAKGYRTNSFNEKFRLRDI
ncbi:4,5-DOPA dioxygenase extradiol [Nitrosomonas ureae]|uniref:4,5-DOPA dioxygenase extradiol n=1 Tax=Nitrosomonas ureae TaxID=44577 RepID=A0A1H2HM04_9PROT|nr:4,5-DOPA dioxygenase extradiol [Nitrosomonas ureae]